ncbi:MAG TPA: bifunctional hydroxymethylpyrimidine kinase/phosphomethylpyrimidine kinase [Thermodesulfobacteriaceae bacterium]|nr:bifunctional hydroxymethylpyrimidine kinase/phosphomethylpyrimidine kinase [Thermodesulfobacteriaceae bacterium]
MLTVLTIAGSDSGGGAGLQQDLKVFTVLGAHGCSVVTALTVQNTLGVHEVSPVEPRFVVEQLEAVLRDMPPAAIKTGMLENTAIVEKVADTLKTQAGKAVIVIDPVMVAKGGHRLLSEEAVKAVQTRLFPLADVVTPNIPEAEVLLGRKIGTVEQMHRAAADLVRLISDTRSLHSGKGLPAVILKGGHLDNRDPVDVMAWTGGMMKFEGKRLESRSTHGTGCTYSAALAVFLAGGDTVDNAANKARDFTRLAIKGAEPLGHGIGPTNPMAVLKQRLERYPVLDQLELAWQRLASLPCSSLVPEIQLNLGYALPLASSPEDVAAFPGRIVRLKSGVARVRGPAFGASSHVARIILTVMDFEPEIRSAMNLRYDTRYLARARELGYSEAEFSRKDEPEDVKIREGSTLAWGVKKAIEYQGRIPDIIHDRGDVGKEPIIRVLGTDPTEVVEKALKIAGIKSD